MTSFFGHLRSSARFPEFWSYSSWLSIATKYRRTRLGLIWAIMPVAVFVGAIGNIYSHLMGHKSGYYIPYLAVGYIVWRFMVQCTNEASSILRESKSFIMDGRIRLTDFVLKSLSKALFYFLISLPVAIVAVTWSPEMHLINFLTILITFPVVFINMIWWSTCVSLIGARHPDAGEVVNTMLRFGMLLTPILWVGGRYAVGSLGWWASHANPAFHLINLVRAPILGESVGVYTWAYLAVMTVGGLALASFLYRRYRRFVPLWI